MSNDHNDRNDNGNSNDKETTMSTNEIAIDASTMMSLLTHCNENRGTILPREKLSSDIIRMIQTDERVADDAEDYTRRALLVCWGPSDPPMDSYKEVYQARIQRITTLACMYAYSKGDDFVGLDCFDIVRYTSGLIKSNDAFLDHLRAHSCAAVGIDPSQFALGMPTHAHYWAANARELYTILSLVAINISL